MKNSKSAVVIASILGSKFMSPIKAKWFLDGYFSENSSYHVRNFLAKTSTYPVEFRRDLEFLLLTGITEYETERLKRFIALIPDKNEWGEVQVDLDGILEWGGVYPLDLLTLNLHEDAILRSPTKKALFIHLLRNGLS